MAYALFGFFIARAIYYQEGYLKLKENLLLFTFIIGTIYGISDEIHQYFVPGRFVEVLDVVADAVGTLIGYVVFNFRRKK